MSGLKPDHLQILSHLNSLKIAPWVGSRKWWPHFVYHTTSLENAVRILQNRVLLSRNRALQTDAIVRDIASTSVIANTNDRWKDYVRFYLRPKTPTLYRNEGARPAVNIVEQAHCPVPVSFMFDAASILTRQDCIFSNGNLGSNSVLTGDSAQFFCDLPFQKIYHESWIAGHERDIIFHRCAEAIIPTSVNLSSLKHVICRSQAEKDTLLNLLGWTEAQNWKDVVAVATKYPLFNGLWNFVREVNYTGTNLIIKFNVQTTNPRGPFKLTWKVKELWRDEYQDHEEQVSALPNDYNIKLNRFENKCLNFQVLLDDHLMFHSAFYHDNDMPF